ncbi:hypothetical protein PBY51_023701 [Eleginops maclovinus]|uniref:Uncharacterized protein n=1 Tax=Eleginops maclovinus TaxID=56733 RepID=A0AAN7WYV7_ELEMC|nr:hypothetical protein PBY51_023701 [Eleginops maclovinus]
MLQTLQRSYRALRKCIKTRKLIFPAATQNRNRLREQTVKTESRWRSAVIGFDTNLKRQVAAACRRALRLTGAHEPMQERPSEVQVLRGA